jgi:septum formation protein
VAEHNQLILASGSPRRRDLLNEAGFVFSVIPADVEELSDASLGAEELVRRNAILKAREVARRFPEAQVIGSDTLVALDDVPFGKPRDLDEAFAMLSRLCGRTHLVLTGVCLAHGATGREMVFVEETRVTFRPLDSDQIRHYLSLIDPLDKAGSYAAQEHGDLIIERTEGSWTNVVGLPMESFHQALSQFHC